MGLPWSKFAEACPELSEPANERFARDQLVMLGTLTRQGWPRISPCELDFAEGHLLLSMMWKSPKALDLLRDPRIVVHSVTTNKDGTDGDFKLYGRAIDIADLSLREAFQDAIRTRTNWAPDEPEFHLFSLEVERAAFVVFGGGQEKVTVWNLRDGLRSWTKAG